MDEKSIMMIFGLFMLGFFAKDIIVPVCDITEDVVDDLDDDLEHIIQEQKRKQHLLLLFLGLLFIGYLLMTMNHNEQSGGMLREHLTETVIPVDRAVNALTSKTTLPSPDSNVITGMEWYYPDDYTIKPVRRNLWICGILLCLFTLCLGFAIFAYVRNIKINYNNIRNIKSVLLNDNDKDIDKVKDNNKVNEMYIVIGLSVLTLFLLIWLFFSMKKYKKWSNARRTMEYVLSGRDGDFIKNEPGGRVLSVDDTRIGNIILRNIIDRWRYNKWKPIDYSNRAKILEREALNINADLKDMVGLAGSDANRDRVMDTLDSVLNNNTFRKSLNLEIKDLYTVKIGNDEYRLVNLGDDQKKIHSPPRSARTRSDRPRSSSIEVARGLRVGM
jgi:hypothetical protein